MQAVTRGDRSLGSGRAARCFAWLGAALVSVGCAERVAEDRLGVWRQAVTGGVAAQRCEWPEVVSLGGCSGTLIHRRLVVYAAHCGTAIDEVRFGIDADRPDRVMPIDRCSTYPNAKLGDGSDLAYCVLADDVHGFEPARVLAGCERDQLRAGREVQLAGFGVEDEGGSYGTLRVAPAMIDEVGDELLISGEGVDTCRGDSGGPVFLPVAGGTELRLIGVTSAGSSGVCGQGVAHYVNLAAKVDWLEEASGLDVTPCFDRGEWAPTPDCQSDQRASMVPPDGADCAEQSEPAWLSTCGEPWRGEPDTQPPVVRFVFPRTARVAETLGAGDSSFETEVEVTAEDRGTGVQGVTFTLRNAGGLELMERVDEVPPYALSSLRLPAGRYVLEAEAQDFSGQSSAANVEFAVTDPTAATQDRNGGGCATARPPRHGPRLTAAALWGAIGGWLARRRAARDRRRRRLARATGQFASKRPTE